MVHIHSSFRSYERKEHCILNTDYLGVLYHLVDALNERFPEGNNPFQITTRLLEESGEIARQVNIREGSGIKAQKHGKPDNAELAKEVLDVLRAALSVARYYGVEKELEDAICERYDKIKH